MSSWIRCFTRAGRRGGTFWETYRESAWPRWLRLRDWRGGICRGTVLMDGTNRDPNSSLSNLLRCTLLTQASSPGRASWRDRSACTRARKLRTPRLRLRLRLRLPEWCEDTMAWYVQGLSLHWHYYSGKSFSVSGILGGGEAERLAPLDAPRPHRLCTPPRRIGFFCPMLRIGPGAEKATNGSSGRTRMAKL